ncbi:MAG: hypothetical protein Q9179_006714 [Wetmoreana sp. 5 TL-2023]
MRSFILAATSLFAAGALAGNSVQLVPRELQVRQSQAFSPETVPLSGTCAQNGLPDCNGICYHPSRGDVCCPDGTYPCPGGNYCLNVNRLCCPNGLDRVTCAAKNGVKLPVSASSSTSHSATVPAVRPTASSSSVVVSSTTAVIETPYPIPGNASVPAPSGTGSPITPFTGGAESLKTYCGGLVAGFLGVIGMLL